MAQINRSTELVKKGCTLERILLILDVIVCRFFGENYSYYVRL